MGTGQVEEFLTAKLPQVSVLRFDADVVKTHVQAKKLLINFYATPGAVLVGTRGMLPYLTQNIETSVVSSLQSLLAIPNYDQEEKVLADLLALSEKTTNHLVIQFPDPEHRVLQTFSRSTTQLFQEQENQLRKNYQYPPYGILISIDIPVPQAKADMVQKRYAQVFDEYQPHTVINPGKRSNTACVHLDLKLVCTQSDLYTGLEYENLRALLRHLPLGASVQVEGS